tara:strand:- start:18417 stop:18656 length:240 start_codon:yes stop_codon:yes gene_type:complete
MKHLLFALLLTAPAVAQSIDPIAYGQRFCALRRMDIDTDAARKAAVSYAYVATRNSADMKADARAAADYVFANCRSLVE